MQIVRANENYITGISKLLVQVNNVHAAGRPDLFKAGGVKYNTEQLAELLGDEKRPVFLAVDDEGVVAGHAFCVFKETEDTSSTHYRKTLYIDDICVDEDHRRMGVGKLLFDYVKGYAKETGCDRVTLNVWGFNDGARAFYEQMGMLPLSTMMETVL